MGDLQGFNYLAELSATARGLSPIIIVSSAKEAPEPVYSRLVSLSANVARGKYNSTYS